MRRFLFILGASCFVVGWLDYGIDVYHPEEDPVVQQTHLLIHEEKARMGVMIVVSAFFAYKKKEVEK